MLSDPALADAIASAVLLKLPDVWLAKSPLVTTEEAKKYLRIESERSFERFCARTGLKPVSKGRYSRQAIERFAERDARGKLS